MFLEDPITKDIQLIIGGHGGVLHPIAVDNDGMNTAELPKFPVPAFIYVTPSHQFPIGGTLPIQRRIDLLNYAQKTGCYIIEDDYDSEFRFDSPPLSSLHGLCPERVVYIGTFSKTLCPAIRIGYMVLPPELISLGSATGLHLVARFRNYHFDEVFFNEVEARGARFYPVGLHALRPEKHRDKIMIGYGNLSTEEIKGGITVLAKYLANP